MGELYDELKISTVVHYWKWWNLRPRFQTDRSVHRHRELKLRVAGPSGAIITVRKRRYEPIIVKGRNEKYTGRFVAGHAPPLSLEYRRRTTLLGCRATISSTRFYPACPCLKHGRWHFSSNCTASSIIYIFIFLVFFSPSFFLTICVEISKICRLLYCEIIKVYRNCATDIMRKKILYSLKKNLRICLLF